MGASHPARVALNDFLASVERRAFFRAKLAVNNQTDALDIVQDAMMKLVRAYSNKDQQEWPLLFNKVLETQIIDWHRRQSIRNRWRLWLEDHSNQKDEQGDTLSLEQVAATELPSQLEHTMLNRSMEELTQALGQLPPRQQQAFLLRAWEGLSVAETANTMGCSAGSVKTHFSRAIHQLQQNITEYDHG